MTQPLEQNDPLDSLKKQLHQASQLLGKVVGNYPPAEKYKRDFDLACTYANCFDKWDSPPENISPRTFIDAALSLDHANDDPDGYLTYLLVAGQQLVVVTETARLFAHCIKAKFTNSNRLLGDAKRQLEPFYSCLQQIPDHYKQD